MKNLLIALLFLISSVNLFGQVETVFALNYSQANCFNARPSLSKVQLLDLAGTIKDELTVNYDGTGNVTGTPVSTNGIIVWDGVLTGSSTAIVTGKLLNVSESYILTSQITDNCSGTLYQGSVRSTAINFTPELLVDCDQVITCALASIDTLVEVSSVKNQFNLDSVTITVKEVEHVFQDTDTYAGTQTTTTAGTDSFGNAYPIGTALITFADGMTLCIPTKAYTDIDLAAAPATITDPDGDVLSIYNYQFETESDGIVRTVDTTAGVITVTHSLDWGIIKDSVLSYIPVMPPTLTGN